MEVSTLLLQFVFRCRHVRKQQKAELSIGVEEKKTGEDDVRVLVNVQASV